jgi:hypothetical protein
MTLADAEPASWNAEGAAGKMAFARSPAHADLDEMVHRDDLVMREG